MMKRRDPRNVDLAQKAAFLTKLSSRQTSTLIAAASLGIAVNFAHGQVSASYSFAGNGNWGTASNWLGGAYPDGGGVASFPVSQTATVTLDVNSTLSGINFAAGVYTIAAGGGAFTLVNAGTINTASGITGTINAPIGGSVGLTKQGAGTLALGGANNFTGSTVIQAGTLNTSANNVLNGTALNFSSSGVSGGTLSIGATNQTVGNISFLAGSSSAGSTIVYGTGNLTLTGDVSNIYNNGYGVTIAAPLVLSGATRTFNITSNANATGDLLLSGAVSGTSNVVKSGSGVLTLIGTNGAFTQANSLTLNAGSLLVSNSTTANSNRIGDTTGIVFNGGVLQFSSPSTGVSEATGSLTVDQTYSIAGLVSGSTAGLNTKLNASNFVRTNRGTELLRGTSLGQGASASYLAPATGNSYFKISDATNETNFVSTQLVGTAATTYTSSTTNLPIVPYLIGDANGTGAGTTFVTYVGTNGVGASSTGPGFIALANGNYVSTIAAGVSDSDVRLVAAQNLGSTSTINALVMNLAAGFTLSGSPLTISSGAAIGSFTAANSGVISNNVTFGSAATPREAVLAVSSGNLTLSGALTAINLTKSGYGSLTLSADNSAGLTGSIQINSGSLVYSADNQLGNAANAVNIQGGSLVYTGATATTSRAVSATWQNPTFVSALYVNAAATSLTLSTPLGGVGTAGLLKAGAGQLNAGFASSFGGVFVQNAGTTSLTGNNTISTGSIQLGAGALQYVDSNSFPTGAFQVFAGTLQATTSNPLTKDLLLAGSASFDTQSNSVTYSGAITPGASGITLTKAGTGTLTFTNTNGGVGVLATAAGNTVFSGANGAGLNYTSFTLAAGTKLVLDNTTINNNRIGNTAGISLTGSSATPPEFILRGSSSGNVSETVGALTTTAGGSTANAPGSIITVDTNGSTGSTVLTFASYGAASFTLYRGTNLGVDPSTIPGQAYTEIFFTTPPTVNASGYIVGALYGNSPTAVPGSGVGSASYSSTFGLIAYSVPMATGNRINNGTPENVATNAQFTTAGATTFVGNSAMIDSLVVANTTNSVTLDAATTTGSLNLAGGGLNVQAGNSGVTFGIGSGTSASINFGAAGLITANSPLTLNLVAAGSAGLTTAGNSNITLGAANTITGGITVGGTSQLTLANGGSLVNQVVTVNSGAQLSFNNGVANTFTSAVTDNGTINISSPSSLTVTTLAGAGTLNTTSGGNLTVVGGTQTIPTIIAGAGNFTQSTGTGTISLTGNNMLSGTITDNTATLEIGAGGSFGTAAVVDNFHLSFRRTDSYTINNNISGTGDIASQSAGTVSLGGTNTYAGATNIRLGTIGFSSNGALPSTSVLTFLDTASTASGFRIADGITVTAAGISYPSTYTGGASAGFVTYISTGTGQLNLNGPLTYTGNGSTSAPTSITGNLNLGAAARDFNITSNGNGAAGGDVYITAAVAGTGGLNKLGTGILQLAGNDSSLSGTVNVNNGTLWNGNSNALGSAAVNLGDTSGSAAAELGIVVDGVTIPNSIFARSGSSANAYLTYDLSVGSGNFSGPVTLNRVVTVGAFGSTEVLSGLISGASGFTISNSGTSGAGSVQFNNQSTYSGGTTLAAGTLLFGSSTTLSGAAIASGPIGTGALTVTSVSPTFIAGIGAPQVVANNITLTGATTFTGTQDITLTGNLSGGGAVTKSGANVLTLAGVNIYTSTTAISAGRLNVNGSHLGGSTYTISAGGTLGGGVGGVGGTVNAPIALSGGVISAGSDTATGILNLTGSSFTVTGASTFTLKIGGTTAGTSYDQIVTSSTALALNGASLNLVDFNGYFTTVGQGAFAAGQKFVILTRPGTATGSAATGTFKDAMGNTLAQGATFDEADARFTINYQGGDGNDIEIDEVPEPTSTAAVFLTAAALLKRRRRATINA